MLAGSTESGNLRYELSSLPNVASRGRTPVSELIPSLTAMSTRDKMVGSDISSALASREPESEDGKVSACYSPRPH